ncbi:MAG: four helix bundle protein, partial [Ignavibacteriae bacterium]|nr:four helix bundle protein [Ignavibacteriota bacterium]
MDHKELDVWKEAIVLVESIYLLTKSLPKEELYNLTSQIRRAAVSVPSNISEGCARKSDKELLNFCFIALGSLAEIDTQLIIINRIYKIDVNEELNQIEKTKKILLGFIR